jgi:hypothetical protein
VGSSKGTSGWEGHRPAFVLVQLEDWIGCRRGPSQGILVLSRWRRRSSFQSRHEQNWDLVPGNLFGQYKNREFFLYVNRELNNANLRSWPTIFISSACCTLLIWKKNSIHSQPTWRILYTHVLDYEITTLLLIPPTDRTSDTRSQSFFLNLLEDG